MKKCTEYTIGETKIIQEYDPDPDTSYLGEYGNEIKPGCIVRIDGTFYEDIPDEWNTSEMKDAHYIHGEFPYFYPPDNGEKPGTENYRKYALQDYENMESLNNGQWGYIILSVKTHIHTNTGLSDYVQNSLSGIEDHYDKDSGNYKKEVVDDLIDENITELEKMGFSLDEIKKSTDNPVYPREW